MSNSSWIQSLACYANKKTCTYVNRTESKEIAFIIALQSVINRYYLALKNIVNFREISYEDNIFRQIKIMSPFISKNVFRVEPEDVLVYNTNEFIVKLVSNLTTFPEGRIDSYCLLQLLRGDYKPVNKINSNLQLLNFQISTQKIPDVTHTFTIKEFNDNQTVICITDREIESLVDPYIDGNGLDILIQTFNRIYDGYITSYYKQIWDNQISHRKLAVLMPDKIQTWSYLFFDELANYNKIGPTDSLKEQMCFHKLIYSFINCNKPSKILFDGQLISCFFSILKKNNCHNQIGFFEKIYTFNEILVHADFDDINLMNKNENWGKISQYKDKIQAIDEMISFLEPILNSSYVNESVISIDNLKKMIRNIIENKLFINDVLVNRPTQLLKKMGYKYNCNIALILNILGALYDHDIRFKKGISKLLKREPSIAYNELVKPYGIKNDKNNNKYLTQYNKFDTTYSVISYDKEISIIDEMKKSKYYK